jgi:hypothetical protein
MRVRNRKHATKSHLIVSLRDHHRVHAAAWDIDAAFGTFLRMARRLVPRTFGEDMFIRMVVAAEAVAALVCAAPAMASPNSVAVAVSEQTAAADAIYGGKPIDYVTRAAIDRCDEAHGPGCVYAGATTNGCVGIAFSRSRGYFEWATGPTISAAEQAAKRVLIADGPTESAGHPVLSAACANGTGDGFSLAAANDESGDWWSTWYWGGGDPGGGGAAAGG